MSVPYHLRRTDIIPERSWPAKWHSERKNSDLRTTPKYGLKTKIDYFKPNLNAKSDDEIRYASTGRLISKNRKKKKVRFATSEDHKREVKDRTVLKLREQHNFGSVTPSAIVPSSSLQSSTYDTPEQTNLYDHEAHVEPKGVDDEVNYFSESELDADYGLRKSTSGSFMGNRGRPGPPPYYPRPASALGPHTQNSRTLGPPKPARSGLELGRDPRTISAPPPLRSPFHSNSESERSGMGGFDPILAGERSGSVSRSGSVTPVVDEEARARMQSMEKQLAGLSSLVHSALSSKGMPDTVFKDLDMLRREILGPNCNNSSIDLETASDSGSISRYSDFFYPPSIGGSDGGGEIVQQIRTAKKKVVELKNDVHNLKRMAQVNAQSSRDILRDTFERVTALINNAEIRISGETRENLLRTDPENAERSAINGEQDTHKIELKKVEGGLSEFESEIELLRQKVVSGDRRLRMHEVEHFTNLLTEIGRTAAKLKTSFPTLQHRLKGVMSAEMEKVVREEKFLKEEPERLDNALRRCKKLTNTMVTMKKLAMVQDPQGVLFSGTRSSQQGFTTANGVPPVPPPPAGYQSPTEENSFSRLPEEPPRTQGQVKGPGGHVLDTLLEELQTVGRSGGRLNNDKRVGFTEEMKKARINGHSHDDRKTPTNEDAENERYGTPEEGRPDPPKKCVPNGKLINEASLPPVKAPIVPPSPADYTPAKRNLNLTPQYNTDPRSGDRSRSGTPNSVNSEPVYSGSNRTGSGKYIPPPPPRSSSRSTQYLNTNGNAHDIEIAELKHQLTTGGTLPRPRIQTNALGDELALHQPMERFTKNASSSESVNSQDGGMGAPGKPPPPPPPRNRQELLEQRHIELLSKQRHLQTQYDQLSMSHRTESPIPHR